MSSAMDEMLRFVMGIPLKFLTTKVRFQLRCLDLVTGLQNPFFQLAESFGLNMEEIRLLEQFGVNSPALQRSPTLALLDDLEKKDWTIGHLQERLERLEHRARDIIPANVQEIILSYQRYCQQHHQVSLSPANQRSGIQNIEGSFCDCAECHQRSSLNRRHVSYTNSMLSSGLGHAPRTMRNTNSSQISSVRRPSLPGQPSEFLPRQDMRQCQEPCCNGACANTERVSSTYSPSGDNRHHNLPQQQFDPNPVRCSTPQQQQYRSNTPLQPPVGREQEELRQQSNLSRSPKARSKVLSTNPSQLVSQSGSTQQESSYPVTRHYTDERARALGNNQNQPHMSTMAPQSQSSSFAINDSSSMYTEMTVSRTTTESLRGNQSRLNTVRTNGHENEVTFRDGNIMCTDENCDECRLRTDPEETQVLRVAQGTKARSCPVNMSRSALMRLAPEGSAEERLEIEHLKSLQIKQQSVDSEDTDVKTVTGKLRHSWPFERDDENTLRKLPYKGETVNSASDLNSNKPLSNLQEIYRRYSSPRSFHEPPVYQNNLGISIEDERERINNGQLNVPHHENTSDSSNGGSSRSNDMHANTVSNQHPVNVIPNSQYYAERQPIKVFVTYSWNPLTDRNSRILDEIAQLCQQLNEADIEVKVDMDDGAYHDMMLNKLDFIDTQFTEARFIIVCISPSYYTDIQPPVDNAQPRLNQLNTRYIFDKLRTEYDGNKCQNRRVIPVLFPSTGATYDHMHTCMKSTLVYSYPQQGETIINNILGHHPVVPRET